MSSGAKRAVLSPASHGWHSACISFSERSKSLIRADFLDVSKSGYRIGLKPMPHIENGSEIILELTDGTRQRVSVCWVSDYEVGLNVIPPDQPRR